MMSKKSHDKAVDKCSDHKEEKRNRYTDEFRADAVRMINELGLSFNQVATQLGCTAESVRRWVKIELEKVHPKQCEEVMNTAEHRETENKKITRLQIEKDHPGWKTMWLDPFQLHNCFTNANNIYNDIHKYAQYTQVLTLYDLLCSIYCEYEDSRLQWTNIAKQIAAVSIDYLKTYKSTLNRSYIVDMGLCASLLIDDKESVEYIATFIVQQYKESVPKVKEYSEDDDEDDSDEILGDILHINIEYIIANYILKKSIVDCSESVSLISKYHVRETQLLLKILEQIETGNTKRSVTAIKQYLSYYLKNNFGNADISYLRRYYCPLLSCLYNIAVKNSIDTKSIDNATFNCNLVDKYSAFKKRSFIFQVHNLILSPVNFKAPKIQISKQICKQNTGKSQLELTTVLIPDDVEDIQDAVNIVQNGGTIKIKPGHYTINKSIEIQKKDINIQATSEHPIETVIECSYDSVLTLSGSNINISGILFISSLRCNETVIIKSGLVTFNTCKFMSEESIGCRCEGRESVISFNDCVFEHCRGRAIIISDGVHATLTGCVFEKSPWGIEVQEKSLLTISRSEVNGALIVRECSSADISYCTVNDISVLRNSKAAFVYCKIELNGINGFECIGSCEQSCITLESCEIKGGMLSPFYASESSTVSAVRCKITYRKKLQEFCVKGITYNECDLTRKD